MNKRSRHRSNLRKLSIAHATGVIDTQTYRRLRTYQLSALEFDKPVPDLPAELADIDVPKEKIDRGGKSRRVPLPALILGLVALLLAAGAAVYLYLNYDAPAQQEPANTIQFG